MKFMVQRLRFIKDGDLITGYRSLPFPTPDSSIANGLFTSVPPPSRLAIKKKLQDILEGKKHN